MQRSCILTYHSLDSTGSVISIRPEVFSAQMAFLAETRMTVRPLDSVRDTPGAIAITFDDGFRNFYQHAFPVLQRQGFAATVFVVSGYCGGRNDWPSQPRDSSVPIAGLMRWSEIEEISRAGIAIGSHTVTHPHLGRLPAAEADQELSASRAAIEDRIGRPVLSLAYPYGESAPAVRAAARRHYDCACGTRLAYLAPDSDPMDLPRIDMYYLQKWFWFQGLTSLRGSSYLSARALFRGLRHRFV